MWSFLNFFKKHLFCLKQKNIVVPVRYLFLLPNTILFIYQKSFEVGVIGLDIFRGSAFLYGGVARRFIKRKAPIQKLFKLKPMRTSSLSCIKIRQYKKRIPNDMEILYRLKPTRSIAACLAFGWSSIRDTKKEPFQTPLSHSKLRASLVLRNV